MPIGVFDSGVGGLTVLSALRARLPNERFIYLGDTARLPYGSKSADTVRRYARQTSELLVARGIKMLVIACNTASAVALDALQQAFAPLPVVGVIEPGAQAACAASRSGTVLVTATAGTLRGGAYQRAIAAIRPELNVVGVACSLFVALAEEGWRDGPIVDAVAERYFAPILDPSLATTHLRVDTVVLGCTHFPVLRTSIKAALHRLGANDCEVVDSAETTARAVELALAENELANASPVRDGESWVHYLATDAVDRFAAAAGAFLGGPIDERAIEFVELR